jgi:hypothetical protein
LTEDIGIIINITNSDLEQLKLLVISFNEDGIDVLERELIHGLNEKSHITAFDTQTYFYRIDIKGVYNSLDRITMNSKVQVTILDDLNIWITTPEL